MLEHTEQGAVGVVINRPLHEQFPHELLPWERFLAEPTTIFHGGPVDESALIALARLDDQNALGARPEFEDRWSPVAGGMGSIDLMLDPDEVAGAVVALRVFQGYSGWGVGQLDDELSVGAWLVLNADAGDVFAPRPEELWRNVLRRQGGRTAWLANAPDDLSAN
ncbi:MAG: YqgE/AlgH family protein [Actinobacteria bacterium]|nr:YqgE/AlgH family protein [Actinomycetota bacterium]